MKGLGTIDTCRNSTSSGCSYCIDWIVAMPNEEFVKLVDVSCIDVAASLLYCFASTSVTCPWFMFC